MISLPMVTTEAERPILVASILKLTSAVSASRSEIRERALCFLPPPSKPRDRARAYRLKLTISTIVIIFCDIGSDRPFHIETADWTHKTTLKARFMENCILKAWSAIRVLQHALLWALERLGGQPFNAFLRPEPQHRIPTDGDGKRKETLLRTYPSEPHRPLLETATANSQKPSALRWLTGENGYQRLLGHLQKKKHYQGFLDDRA